MTHINILINRYSGKLNEYKKKLSQLRGAHFSDSHLQTNLFVTLKVTKFDNLKLKWQKVNSSDCNRKLLLCSAKVPSNSWQGTITLLVRVLQHLNSKTAVQYSVTRDTAFA